MKACEHHRLSSEKRSRALSLTSNDTSVKVLKCRPDGRFEPVQCDEVTGQCWCVDEAGFELGGTRANSKNAVNCTCKEFFSFYLHYNLLRRLTLLIFMIKLLVHVLAISVECSVLLILSWMRMDVHCAVVETHAKVCDAQEELSVNWKK